MAYRDGSTSTFSVSPSGIDNFPILASYDPDAFVQAPNSLITAAHLNKYFDAIIKIQDEMWGNLGGALWPVIPTSSTPATGASNSLLSYKEVTFRASSEVTTLTVSVPSGFGNDPFHNLGFSIAHTAHFRTDMDDYLKGVLSGKWSSRYSPSPNGILNDLMLSPQLYTVVEPISGSLFNLHLVAKSFHSLTGTLDDSKTDDLQLSFFSHPSPAIWTEEANGISGTFIVKEDSLHNRRLQINSYYLGVRRGGALLAHTRDSDDFIVQFKGFGAGNAGSASYPDTGNECYCRVGPVVNFYGTSTNCSFYGLIFGDVPITASNPSNKDRRLWARLVKVTNHNLLTGGNDNSTAWGGDTGGQVTPLYGDYIDFDDDTITDIRLRKVGNVLHVEKSFNSGSSWSYATTGAVTVTSPLSSIASGVHPKAGFIAKGMDGDAVRYLEFCPEIKVIPTDSFSGVECKVNLLYMLIGSNSSFLPLVDQRT